VRPRAKARQSRFIGGLAWMGISFAFIQFPVDFFPKIWQA
jgi:hypothetical protein